jgi:hypothetical protein
MKLFQDLRNFTPFFSAHSRGYRMQDTPLQDEAAEQDYQAGFARVIWFNEQAQQRGWKLSDRQLVHEIVQRERAALIREKASLPMMNQKIRSAAWNRGQADALRLLLRAQQEN